MQVVVEPYESLPCELRVFKINGIEADVSDFGFICDDCPETAEEYGCGDMRFHSDLKRATQAMRKYNIKLEQFIKICEKLESVLCVGKCGWCI